MDRLRLTLCIALLAPTLSGCSEGCLGGEPDCRLPSPCGGLHFSCADRTLELRVLDQAGAVLARSGWNALASAGDVLLGNGQIVAVVAGPDHPTYLDPGGGALLDLRPRDGTDGLNQVLQVTGILPRDAAHYTEVILIDERPHRVAVQLGGTLDGQPEARVHTLYEVRPCEPGVRVRTEVVNGTPDTLLWAALDGFYWSGREMLPFTPGPGFSHPPFNLLTIDGAFRSAPLLAASTHSPPDTSYAAVACHVPSMSGFHSNQVSAMGLPRTVVVPRDYQVFERFLAVAPGAGAAPGVDLALRVREQLFGEPAVQLRGQIDRGAPVSGERDASILVLDIRSGEAKAVTQAVPAADGSFRVLVPAGGDYLVQVHAFGRQVAEVSAMALHADRDLGTIPLPRSATLSATVIDAQTMAPTEAEIFLAPADPQTRAAVEGSFHGVYEKCAPWLGIPYGPSPACNQFLVSRMRAAEVQVPPGRYHLYAYHGPFYTIARQTVELRPGQAETVRFVVQPLAGLRPPGTLSADLHVHGAASFDSSLPDADRVLSFAAADVDVIVATDHDVVHDYAQTIRDLGLQDRLSSIAGVETTGHIPALRVPGDPLPRVIGHYNFWPLAYRPGLPRNGAPHDELIEPGALFDRMDPLYEPGRVPVIQLNHPWAEPEFGRDLGFPRALGLNLLRDLPPQDDGTAAGMYVRSPQGRRRNNDHHVQEVMNGTQNDLLLPYRAFWFYSLNQGQFRTGTANSDSHGLSDNTVGSPRNLVHAGTQAGPGFDVDRFNQALRDGFVLGTNGPIIEATLEAEGGQEVGYGLRLIRPAPGGRLKLAVSAAPWVPVEEVRIIVNGQIVRVLEGSAILRPQDPFGTAGLVRFQGAVPLAELLPRTGDAWIVVEAGARLPLAGDLSGPAGVPDGVPDTTDNNGDGHVDAADVEMGRTSGPLRNPAPPTDEADPRFHFAQVVPGGYPMAFTNPFVLDLNGNGRFDAPGAAGGR